MKAVSPTNAPLAIALALCSVIAYAVAAALQRREAAAAGAALGSPPSSGSNVDETSSSLNSSAGRLFFTALVRRPRWWLGIGSMSAGGILHVAALGVGTVSLVQPIGVLAIVLGLPLDARFRHQRVAAGQWLSAGVLVIGLAALLVTAPRHSTAGPSSIRSLLAWEAVVVAGVLLLVGGGELLGGRARRRATPRGSLARAVLRAAAAGTCLGATSAMVRTAFTAFPTDLAVGAAATAGAVVLPVAGVLLQQTAYRSGGLGAPLATMSTVDPATALALGPLLLGERFPSASATILLTLAGATAAFLGLCALVRTSPH